MNVSQQKDQIVTESKCEGIKHVFVDNDLICICGRMKRKLMHMSDDEYDPDGRFAWDMIRLTEVEINKLVDFADAGQLDEADAVADGAEQRLFGATQ